MCVKNKWNLQITDYSLRGRARVLLAVCVCERAAFSCRDGGERGHFNEGMFSCVFVAQAAAAGAALAVMARVAVRLTVFRPNGSVQVNYTEKNEVFFHLSYF